VCLDIINTHTLSKLKPSRVENNAVYTDELWVNTGHAAHEE